MSQLVDPGQIPQVGTGIEWVETVAGWLQTDAIRIRAAGTDVTAAWSGLAGVYHAPEAAELVAALSPVAVLADQFGADVLVVAAALSQFAETVAPLRSRLLNAQYDANSLRTRAMATDHWDRHADMVAENNRLVWEVDAAFTAFLDAERRCANTIEGLVGGASWHAGDPSKDARANGPASIPDNAATPWGAPAKLHRSCVQASVEAASAFNPLRPNAGVGQGEWDAITGMAAGAWQMVDVVDPARFRATWSQIGVLATPLGGQRTAEAWLGVGKGMISWDEWSTTPSGAAGGALINVGSLFLPGAGEVGGAAKIAEGTGDAARFADAAKVAEAERVASELEAATVAELQFTEELVGRDLAALEGMPRAEDLDNLLRNKFGDLEGANSPVNQLEDKLAKSAAEAKAPAQASTSPDSVRRSASGSGNSGP
ncbi:MAG: hypothetical protein JWO63_2569, partial [Frankiales bacterium]|nr:hypothetical protein [Frankiales bacterium]